MTETSIRAVWPEVPEPTEWLSYLEETRPQNWHTNFGPLVRRFEARLHELYGHQADVAVSASNATSALSACLVAHNIRGPVLCPAFTFQATACAILGAGCQPVIVDVHPQSGIISADALDHALKVTGARAAIVVAPYGISADFRTHARVSQAHGARLVIDNAAGLGIPRNSFDPEPHVDEVYSLHATKPFGIGEGGLIFTAPEHEAALRSAMNFGIPTHTGAGQNRAPYWGINGKLTEAGAAIGLAVAEGMARRVEARQTMVREWMTAMSGLETLAFSTDVGRSPWQVFPLILPDEAAVLRFAGRMADAGIETRRYYAPSLGACHGMRAFDDCSNARSLAERAVTLPVRSFMSAEDRQSLMATTLSCLTISLS
jgi:dTDP-4-amino-4,6-dideoxygalactose transaminase